MLCISVTCCLFFFFFFKQKTAYDMRISDWSADVCSSDLLRRSCDRVASRPSWERQARADRHQAAGCRQECRTSSSRSYRPCPPSQLSSRTAAGKSAARTVDVPAGGAVGTATLCAAASRAPSARSEEHTSELQSLMRISYAVFCLKKKTNNNTTIR